MNMQKMMKELQKMQTKMTKAQSELAHSNFEADAGGGMVKVVMDGTFNLVSLKINQEAVDPEDVEALEDLILAAFKAAKEKVDAKSQEQMGGLTAGLKLPI